MNIIKKYYDKRVFLTAFFATFIIHGERLFQVLCWYDDATYIYRGWNDGLRHGRWLHHVIATIIERVSGHEIVPTVSGMISAICIACIACLLFKLLDIKEYWIQFPLIMIFCAIPAVAGHFGYIGSAGYDFFGKLLCVLGAFILCKGLGEKNCFLKFVIASLLFACSLGEYQCYVAFYLMLLLVYFTREMLEKRNTWKEFWTKAIYYVASAVAGLGLYLLMLQIFLRVLGKELTSYAGTDTFGIVGISEYINRVVYAYTDFINPDLYASYNMFPFHWDGWHAGLMLGLFGLMAIALILKFIKKDYRSALQSMIAFALLPLGLNFNFVVYGAEATHSLHMYHFVLLYIYLFVLARGIVKDFSMVIKKDDFYILVTKGIYGLTAAVVFVFGMLYIRYDNYCYMQIEVRQEAAIGYFNTLITRIQSTKGFDDDYAIAFIDAEQKENSADEIIVRYDPIVTNPYSTSIVNSYNWDDFMRLWCGFDPDITDASVYEDNELVKDMPSYPDDGSIRIIDEVVVVKF